LISHTFWRRSTLFGTLLHNPLKILTSATYRIIKMVRLTQLLSEALRRRSSDQQQRSEDASVVEDLSTQTEGLSVAEAHETPPSDDLTTENYAITWKDPSKFAKEKTRVALLQSFAVLRTPAEERFDCITK
jgi:hypothetical protein